ncbi:hypothetical protein GCM10010313_26850 [Streptomyces violarus]|uniref:Uncharacterized protein n=1 Tax=Streptomyces violarus TaxID=67380 RepID=A0A7W4ZYA1_9ACTN|nr:hypothetical protein [Streptomyces violarus]MBB3080891.1 hypothetical protein [Streptomyces violarus]GHD07556.1 hypothetical protein GCM10010313_26850 [Streptomyces violarus]
MASDHDMLWRRCARLGRVLLPLVDQEPWRQARRHENLRDRGIDPGAGKRLIEVFAALAAHAIALDASVSAAQFDALPLKGVTDAVTGKQDYELLAGLPGTFADDRDQQAVNVLRLYIYKGGQYSHRLLLLRRELHHALNVLAERSPTPPPTCGDMPRRAAEAGASLSDRDDQTNLRGLTHGPRPL